MRKRWTLLIRVMLILAGLAIIVYIVDWRDTLVMPDGQAWRVTQVTDEGYRAGPPDGLVQDFALEDVDAGPETPQFKPGVVRMLRGADPAWLVAGWLVLLTVWPMQAARWWVLLRCRGLLVGPWRTFKLTMAGLFAGFALPGMTGGDVVRAYYAAQGAKSQGVGRADAVVSIGFDRLAGLVGLLIVGGVGAGVALLGCGQEAVLPVAQAMALFCLGLVVGALIYFTPVLRRVSGLDWLVGKLPRKLRLHRLDEALLAYRGHPGALLAAVGFGVLVQGVQIVAIVLIGRALGITTPWQTMLVVLPVLLVAGALPISYQGLGLMEGAGALLLSQGADAGATNTQVVGMLLMLRVFTLSHAALGCLTWIRGGIRLHPEPASEEAEDRAVEPEAG